MITIIEELCEIEKALEEERYKLRPLNLAVDAEIQYDYIDARRHVEMARMRLEDMTKKWGEKL